jgi:signal transduction histidine kinase
MAERFVDRISTLELARLDVARLELKDSDDLRRAMATATRVSAATLGVTRVGIWALGDGGRTLRSVHQHREDGAAGASPTQLELPLDRWPAYGDAVRSRRVVAAEDARTDPRTRELGDEYLVPHGVTAMLDVPLFLGGDVWGIVCHEHVGGPRAWTPREMDFGVSVADMLSALLEQSMRLATEERLRAREALLARARQAEAVVRTAAGIGHDVNNVLQAIMANTEVARRAHAEGDRASALGAIADDCQRAARIVEQLRHVERPVAYVGTEADLSFVVSELKPTLEALLGARHVLVTDLAPQAVVGASRADVERIVLNLVVNARDAMPGGGTVTVAVDATRDGVRLTVRDHGVGISPQHVERIFEPYFTTKDARGTGLGLFAVDAIGRRTGARTAVESTPGVGTAFTVSWARTGD